MHCKQLGCDASLNTPNNVSNEVIYLVALNENREPSSRLPA